MVSWILIKRPARVVWLFIAGLFIWSATVSSAAPTSVSLAWAPAAPGDSAVGYRVYYGTQSRTYTETIDAGDLTTCTIATLTPQTTYFVTVTAYDWLGNESAFGEELVIDQAPPAILGLEDLDYELRTTQSVARLPDLCDKLSVRDDVAEPSQCHLTQSPAAGALLGLGEYDVTITASDPSGNLTTTAFTYRITSPEGERPSAVDSDGDGMADAAEYVAGSDETDATSYPRLILDTSTGARMLRISGVTANSDDQVRLATLESCTNLTDGVWNQEHTGTLSELIDMAWPCNPAPGSRTTYYRLRVALP